MEKSANDDDHVYEQDGFKVVVAKEYDNYYKKLEVDFINDERGQGFTIRDTAKASCADSGCSGCS